MKNYVETAYNLKEKPIGGKYPRQLAQYLIRRYEIKNDMKLLDNGCGRGEFLCAFKELGIDAYGTDISKYFKKVKILNFEEDRLPYEDEYFDVVFSKSVLEHITNYEHYMSEMKRVLKKGGRLILLVPDWETQYKIFYQDPTHVHPYTVCSIERLLKMMEFKRTEVEKFQQLPVVWNYRFLNAISGVLRLMGPVKKVYKNKFVRFSRELMVLGTGIK